MTSLFACPRTYDRSGIPSKLVQDAVSEVADDFNAYSRKRKSKSLLDPSTSLTVQGQQGWQGSQGGQGSQGSQGWGQDVTVEQLSLESRRQEDDSSAYNVSLGQRYVLQSKFLVTFRMVDTIMVFYVAEPDSNPLISLRYVDAAAKILVGLSKGVDISHKRLAKKYADLYVLLGKLLARGVRHLPGAFIHAPATNEKLLTMPVSAFEGKRKLKKVLENKKTKNAFVRTTTKDSEAGEDGEDGENRDGGEGRDGGQAASVSGAGVAGAQDALMRRVWDQSGHDVRTVEFEVPAGALPPPPNRVVGAMRTPPAPPLLSEAFERAWSGAVSASASDAGSEEGVLDEDVDAQPEATAVDLAGGVEEMVEEGVAAGAGAEILRLRRQRIRDLRQAVVMVEVWKGVVKSNTLSSVCVHGAIKRALAPYNVSRVLFRMHPSHSMDVDAALRVASLHNKYVKLVEDGSKKNASTTFSAALSGIPIDATYLKYALPNTAVRPPLQASLVIGKSTSKPSASSSSTSSSSSHQLLVCIPYAVDPDLTSSISSLVDVSITVSFPPDIDGLQKTSHQAEWCPVQSKIQWKLAALEAGAQGVVRAVVSFKGVDPKKLDETTDRISSAIRATILFSGYPGRSYSGLAFDLGEELDEGQGTNGEQFFAGNVRTFGELALFI